MRFSKSPSMASSQNGSALTIILITVALFAALGFALSQQGDTAKGLTAEKSRLLVADVIDMGNKMSDTVAQLRLRGVKASQISFANAVVTGYNNLACTTDKCKIFAFDGGGRDWEKPVSEINGGLDWSYTGDLAITNIGGADADLVALLPKLSLDLCNQINKALGLTDAAGPPPSFSSAAANKYTGSFSATPSVISNAAINGQKSGCISLSSPSGTAFDAFTGSAYVYYQILEAR